MIKALSLAATLALLPLSSAVAQDAVSPSEAAIETAAQTLEVRMEDFGERAAALSLDQALPETEREIRMAALWAEYQPDIAAFAATAAMHATAIAAEALADIDLEAVAAEALAGIDMQGAMAMAGGVARNGAWASNDPEHMVTYGLMADYVLGQAIDAVDEVEATVDNMDDIGPTPAPTDH
ncbi:hypothetical protein [uncultured Brevundimonas sp.]|uniref:hypothetical protein n=1 Tax=uncultured Brevundimonas sp. TaxID=213418 RepID=UPI0030EBC6FD|tara:strand:- start:7704 stop:8246 length:543 start_codon:yes stop_codon:yes gene_type:complete